MSLAALWLSVSACVFNMKAQQSDNNTVKIQIQAVPFELAGDSGSEAKAYEERWQEGDSVAVWADSVALCYYHLVSGAGKSTASFEGPALKDSVTYYASMPGDMPGDTLTGSVCGGKTIVLEHSSSFMRFSFKVPSGNTATGIGLIPMSLKPIAFEQKLDSLSGSVEVLVPSAPVDWSAETFAATVVYAGNTIGTSRVPGWNLQASKGVEYRFDPITVTGGAIPESAVRTVDNGQVKLSVSAGQYSGISYMEGTRYAVVHDKSKGGGIHFFDINLDSAGKPVSVTSSEAPANAGQKGGRDNEDVVYLPESRTLLVSAESDQSILEYDLEGNPTGRKLSIPADLNGIQSNAGFEALGYNAGTGLIWTMTEKPLKDDYPSTFRLQSFSDKTFEPAERYIYLASLPVVSGELAAKALAYVFGVSAITALDDGRLIVLEREVYVPSGNYIQKAIGSFTRINLYLVDPVNDTAGFLQKQLLANFTTGAVNLANFEGMCLGPRLDDGRIPLILIADSQGGMSGLTSEYIRVLLIKP